VVVEVNLGSSGANDAMRPGSITKVTSTEVGVPGAKEASKGRNAMEVDKDARAVVTEGEEEAKSKKVPLLLLIKAKATTSPKKEMSTIRASEAEANGVDEAATKMETEGIVAACRSTSLESTSRRSTDPKPRDRPLMCSKLLKRSSGSPRPTRASTTLPTTRLKRKSSRW